MSDKTHFYKKKWKAKKTSKKNKNNEPCKYIIPHIFLLFLLYYYFLYICYLMEEKIVKFNFIEK